MKRRYWLLPFLMALGLGVGALTGCASAASTTPPAALAPGYSSQADQTIGQSLAALHAFVDQAVKDYQKLTPAQQQVEKNALNAMVAAVNIADTTYLAFHTGQATLQQAQNSLAAADASQSQFVSTAGVK